jgi:hypothetical protein
MTAAHAHQGHIYGVVNSIKDIGDIERKIRHEIDQATTHEQLTELKKRSDYLCTLTFSPSWEKKFGDEVVHLRQAAEAENRKTVEHANNVAQRHGWPAKYEPWGKNRRSP